MSKPDYLNQATKAAHTWMNSTPERRRLLYADYLTLVELIENLLENGYADGASRTRQADGQ